MARASNLELPNAEELRVMIRKESPRKAERRDYLEKNPQIFTAFKECATIAGVDVEILDVYAALDFEVTIARLITMADDMERALAVTDMAQWAQRLHAPLSTACEPQLSDAIFVFGSPQNLRISKAVELYDRGVAPRLIVTGAAPHWGSNEIAEADRAAEFAVLHGVPKEAIFVENRSIATPDNVKRVVDAWQLSGWQPQTVTIVTSEFNIRRAEMDMYKFPLREVRIFAAAPPPSDELNSQNWIKTERGRRIIINEYAKLIMENKIDQALAEGTL